MILFCAEAIFSSSTSKSGIRISLLEHVDFRSSTKSRSCSSGSSPAHQTSFRGALWGEHLFIRVRSYHDQPHGPIRFPQHLFSVHDHGRQRSDRGPQRTFLPLRWLSIFHFHLGISRYCVCCLSCATRQFGCDIHDVGGCHLRC